MHIHGLIEDSVTLAELCKRLAQSDFITVDTEFMRENSYWPELCLIQVANDREAAAIDPMAPNLDMGPLLELMVNNEDVLKVFHAGGQDIEIVYNLTGKTPHPMFDTQVAAMALGQGEQVGYSNLVETYLGIVVDKGARFTDWARRPLDKRQIDYAIADVTHLSTIFPKMLEKLRKSGRGVWLDQEMERISDPENYRNDPDQVWQRVRINSRKPEVLGPLARAGSAGQGSAARPHRQGRDAGGHRRQPAAQAGRSRQGARPLRRLGRQRYRRPDDGGDRRFEADAGGRDAWP